MAIIQTVLNYTRANSTNFADTINIPVTDAAEVLLLSWGHFVPGGTQFIEVNSCIGYEGDDGAEGVEFRLYQDGTLVATANDNADDIGTDVDALTHFKAILTSDPGIHIVFQLRAITLEAGQTVNVQGPVTASAVSYGTI